MSQHRMPPERRKEVLLRVAADLACSSGYTHVTRDAIAEAAGLTAGAVSYHFGTMAALRLDLLRWCIDNSVLPVVAQGIALREPLALAAPQSLQRKALRDAGRQVE